MNRTANKRKLIFDAFSQQWELLKRHNYLKGIHQKYVGNYICPICLRHFSPKDLNQALPNPLTLEDAPPKELGGKANTLTCKECNNTLGSKVDSHLTVRLKDLDKRSFLPGTEGKVKVIAGDQIVQGTLSVKDDGTIQMFHSNKNNHPQKLEEFITSVGPESEFQAVSIKFGRGNFSPKKLEYAVLKTAYMLVFERFGYAFVLDPVFDRIREQLLHPDQDIYPSRFWYQAPYPKKSYGVHFITESGLESILVIFEVKTNNTERVFAAILPLPFNNIDAILEELNQRFKVQKGFHIKGAAFDPNADYLRDIKHISHTLNWIETKKG